jgi:hypothetical protein
MAHVEPLTVGTHRFDNHVHVRVRLIRMKNHGVTVLECKLLASEVLNGHQELLWGRAGGHREDGLVHQLCTFGLARDL